MKYSSKITRVAAAVALSLTMAGNAIANDTTSSIRGRVIDQSGNIASDAVVTIVHGPSGASKTIEVNDTGTFLANGLRVGGPYTVTVKDASGTKKLENIFLSLGEVQALTVGLESQENIESIVVTGTLTNSNYGEKGPASNFSLTDLENAPAMNRDIKDLVRIDPRVYVNEADNDGIQCAGASSRFNSLTLDGIRANDNFGLNRNGYPTIRQPFSYDAIDQVAVELAPFDVQYGGFTACNINAVTKTGTNEFHGGMFYDYTSDSLTGNKIGDESVTVGAFTQERYGFTVGGPILEDQLFFFIAYEHLDGADLFDRGPVGSGRAVEVADFTQEKYNEILDIAQNVYGYEPGDNLSSRPNEDDKLLIKLDWQISDDHRATLVYNYNDGNQTSESDGDADEFEFSNHYYEQSAKLESFIVSLFSDWTDNFSTEIRVGHSELDQSVTPLGGLGFGEVQIRTGELVNGRPSGSTVYLGADDSRHANKLNYKTDTLRISGKYLWGDHVFSAGYELETFDVFNLFVQEALGEYRFDTIEDFRNGIASRITYENARLTNNPDDAAAKFKYSANTVYLQDEYYFIDYDLTVTAGLRYDWYTSNDLPAENTAIEEIYGFSNQQNMDGRDLIQPRVGFNWMVDDQLEVRGGFGLYSGGNPNVWISNSYSNNGVIQLENQDRTRTPLFDMQWTGSGRPIHDIPQHLYDAVANGEGRNGGVNIMDPNFEIPSEWKYALGATYTFENDYVLMADILYSDKQDAAIISDITRQRTSELAPDGRPIYESINGRSQDFMLTNVKGDSGHSTTFSLALNKSHDFGLDWSVSYAYTESKEVSPMTSSVAFSNYLAATTDPENPGVTTSNYEIPHRFTFRVGYSHEFFDNYATKFSLFGTINEGRPYSYVFDGNGGAFGDSVGFIDRHLIYVPTGPDDDKVVFGPDFDKDAFFAFVKERGLDKYSGQIMDRNSLSSQWWTKLDFQITQELPGLMDGHKANAYLIIENLGNLLDSGEGLMYETSFPRAQDAIGFGGIENGKYLYNSFNASKVNQTVVSDASLYQIRIGVRYKF